eukprot:6199510-Pleurochrysis_carterae.AAC.4
MQHRSAHLTFNTRLYTSVAASTDLHSRNSRGIHKNARYTAVSALCLRWTAALIYEEGIIVSATMHAAIKVNVDKAPMYKARAAKFGQRDMYEKGSQRAHCTFCRVPALLPCWKCHRGRALPLSCTAKAQGKQMAHQIIAC